MTKSILGEEYIALVRKAVDEALLPLMRERIAKDGAPWIVPADRAWWKAYPPLRERAAKTAYPMVEEALGRPLEHRPRLWRETKAYRELMEANGGVADAEVDRAFAAQFPKVLPIVIRRVVGKMDKAETYMGDDTETDVTLPAIPGLEDARQVLSEIEKLEKRRSVLQEKLSYAEVELKEVNRQLEAYAPMKRALEVLRTASHKIREAARGGLTT